MSHGVQKNPYHVWEPYMLLILLKIKLILALVEADSSHK